jgi:hypothetical protein
MTLQPKCANATEVRLSAEFCRRGTELKPAPIFWYVCSEHVTKTIKSETRLERRAFIEW